MFHKPHPGNNRSKQIKKFSIVMSKALKNFIKSILPGPILNQALDIKDQISLSKTPLLDFDPAALAPINDNHLNDIFADPEITKSWESDHSVIREIFGDHDEFGGVNPGDRRALYYLIRDKKPKSVLEVGTHIGASTLYIAKALQTNGDGHLTTVDIYDVNDPENGSWKKYNQAKAPIENVKELSCSDHVNFVASPAVDFLMQHDQKFDFIFLDGDHQAGAVYQEVSASLKRLNQGGVILLHDFYPEGKALFPDDTIIKGPWRAFHRIREENPSLNVLPLGNLPWETKQNVKITSLALLTQSSS